MTKPKTYSPPWPVDAAMFEEGKREGLAYATGRGADLFKRMGYFQGAYDVAVAQIGHEHADLSRHAPWGGAHGRAEFREDWAAGFREGYAEGARTTPPCPDGDACPDAKRHGAVHPAPARGPRPRFTLDSTVREVMGALEGVEGLKVVPAEGTWTVGGSTLGRVRPGFEDFAKTIPAPWEASGLVMGQDAHGNKVVTRRLSALAPTHLEALVALANVVVGEG